MKPRIPLLTDFSPRKFKSCRVIPTCPANEDVRYNEGLGLGMYNCYLILLLVIHITFPCFRLSASLYELTGNSTYHA